MKIALHWFRRDLRLADNTALWHAHQDCDQVYPIFIFDPKILTAPDIGAPRVQFLLESLDSLQKNLSTHGSELILRRGDLLSELEKLVGETKATSIYWNRDYEPYARERDARVEKHFSALGVTCHHYKDGVLQEPEEVLKSDGSPYAVFTPYSKLWRTKPTNKPLPLPNFRALHSRPDPRDLPSLSSLGFSQQMTILKGGERAALGRLKTFLSDRIQRYQSQRNFPSIEGTSRLSADLRFGTLSPRQAYAAAQKAMAETPAPALKSMYSLAN